VDPAILDDPNVDVVSNHYYWPPGFGDDYAAALRADLATVAGARPFIVGEFGLVSAARVEALLDAVVDEGAAGALDWSLRYHDVDGGFYWHSEGMIGPVDWQAYHWPGFAAGDAYEESAKLAMLAERGWALQGVSPPPTVTPIAPVVLAAPFADTIRWQGVAGAASYTLECADDPAGPWAVCVEGVVDVEAPNRAEVADPTAVVGGSRYYRMRAIGSGGASPPSASVGPVRATAVGVDPLDDLSRVEGSVDVGVDTANVPLFRGDAGRLFRTGPDGGEAVWRVDDPLVQAELTVYHWPGAAPGALRVEASADGVGWEAVAVTEVDEGGDWQRIVLTATPKSPATWLRVTFVDHAGPSWTPQVGEVTLRSAP
jgi:hypothetical protein